MVLRKLFIGIFIMNCLISFGQNTHESSVKKVIVLGESITMFSETQQENRTINIYLPSGYQENETKSYQVIYLLDGSLDEDYYIHIAGLVQFGSFPWVNLLPETILVGIANVD